MDLLVSIDTIGGHVVVTPRGTADLSSVPTLHSRLQRAVSEHPGRSIVVDLDGLFALDDVALGVLLGAAARARDLGGDLAVVSTNERVVGRLRATGFDRAVEVRGSLTAASRRDLEPHPTERSEHDAAEPSVTASPSVHRYVAVIFTSRHRGTDRDEYAAAAHQMELLAAQQPGFRGVESVRGDDGVGITVSYWDSEADARAWKAHHEHLVVQRAGRARWYEWYRVRVAEVVREYDDDRRRVPGEHERAGDARRGTR